MAVEMNERLVAAGFDPTDEKYLKDMQRKDSTRRWSKLMDEQASVRESSPAFLTETTFDLKVEQYKALIGHVEALWSGSFPTCGRNYCSTMFPVLLLSLTCRTRATGRSISSPWSREGS